MKRSGLLLLTMLLGGAAVAGAHQLSTSYTTVTVTPQKMVVELAFRPRDLAEHFGLDKNGDGQIDAGELANGAAAMDKYFASHVTLGANFSEIEITPGAPTLAVDETGPLARFTGSADLAGMPGEVVLQVDLADRMGKQHVNFAKLVAGEEIQQAVLSHEQPRHHFTIGGGVPLAAQVGAFIKLGIGHIFLGYDHIMFLVALIVVGSRLKDLLKIVTAFTVAHSITLTLAALEIVRLPSRLIESGIALSIVYVACENFWIKETSHRWMLTFCFGLVHGFGFANVLRDLGLPSRGLIASLLAFNVGVEIGQIAIVAILFPVTLWLSRKWFQHRVVLVVSVIILLFGLGWLIERAFGLSFMPI